MRLRGKNNKFISTKGRWLLKYICPVLPYMFFHLGSRIIVMSRKKIHVSLRLKRMIAFYLAASDAEQSCCANHFQSNAGLLDGVIIGPPTRTRVTPGNTVSVGNTIVG